MQKKSLASFAAGLTFAVVLLGGSKMLHADPPPTFAGGETLSAAKLNTALSTLNARIDAVEKAGAPTVVNVPAGAIVAFGGNAVPAGWKLCDGSSVSRAESAALFAAVGTAWGSGDGSTTFNLPDLRGRFTRGVDHGANRDPDKVARTAAAPGANVGDDVGSLQESALEQHNHNYVYTAAGLVSLAGGASPVYVVGSTNTTIVSGIVNGNISSETRPKNAYVNYIIKE